MDPRPSEMKRVSEVTTLLSGRAESGARCCLNPKQRIGRVARVGCLPLGLEMNSERKQLSGPPVLLISGSRTPLWVVQKQAAVIRAGACPPPSQAFGQPWDSSSKTAR
ncbi:unnamed protein product [Rangifer tarandus platyrhynchus]|uniref:Uncharacterized protein n=1 Tax=Rangifer tarandus platyrhynchus TaxID=3082113 RepID=A0ABN8Y7A9_RANTA|nr:unnamed protein product [Rangifer tarandus platyrhynchus]